jgi:hypothetical protein
MASVNKTPVIANPTYVLNLAHVKSAAYIRPFKRNALPWFQVMSATDLGTTHSNPLKIEIVTGIRTIVKVGLRLEEHKLKGNNVKSRKMSRNQQIAN